MDKPSFFKLLYLLLYIAKLSKVTLCTLTRWVARHEFDSIVLYSNFFVLPASFACATSLMTQHPCFLSIAYVIIFVFHIVIMNLTD